MHPRFVFALLFTVCVFGLGIAKPATPKCGPNAEFNVCGSICTPTCAKPIAVERCPDVCLSGCFCKKGFLKNANGECVPKKDCDIPHPPIQKPLAAESLEEPVRKPIIEPQSRFGGPIIEPIPIMQQQMADFPQMPGPVIMPISDVQSKSWDPNHGPIIEPIPVMASGVKPIEPMSCGKNAIYSLCAGCDATCLDRTPKCNTICKPGCRCNVGYVRVDVDRCELAEEQCPNPTFGVKSSKDGEIHILPFPEPKEEVILPQSNKDGEIHILPFPDPKEEVILPMSNKDGEIHILPFPEPKEEVILPMSNKDGEIHILPFPDPKEEVILPMSNKDGEIHILPVPMPDPNIAHTFQKTLDSNPKCAEHQIYMICGPATPPTCENPKRGTIHIEECVSGCFCKAGYLLNQHGVCVPATQCTTNVGVESSKDGEIHILPFPEPNEEVILPMSNKDGEVHILPYPEPSKNVILPMSEKKGEIHILPYPAPNEDVILPQSNKDGEIHILPFPEPNQDVILPMSNKDNEIHILPIPGPSMKEEPTPTCKTNEVFSTCGPLKQATCQNPLSNVVHTEECVAGCVCKEGHLRNKQGICVPVSQCFVDEGKCMTKRETFFPNMGAQLDCMNSCDTPTKAWFPVPILPNKCKAIPMNQPACICDAPYTRNRNGQCVERKECGNTN